MELTLVFVMFHTSNSSKANLTNHIYHHFCGCGNKMSTNVPIPSSPFFSHNTEFTVFKLYVCKNAEILLTLKLNNYYFINHLWAIKVPYLYTTITSGAGTAYPPGVPEFPRFVVVLLSLVFFLLMCSDF